MAKSFKSVAATHKPKQEEAGGGWMEEAEGRRRKGGAGDGRQAVRKRCGEKLQKVKLCVINFPSILESTCSVNFF